MTWTCLVWHAHAHTHTHIWCSSMHIQNWPSKAMQKCISSWKCKFLKNSRPFNKHQKVNPWYMLSVTFKKKNTGSYKIKDQRSLKLRYLARFDFVHQVLWHLHIYPGLLCYVMVDIWNSPMCPCVTDSNLPKTWFSLACQTYPENVQCFFLFRKKTLSVQYSNNVHWDCFICVPFWYFCSICD